MVSAILLREQSKILNVNAKHEVITEIKQVSALLLSKSNAVPMYGLFAKLHLLPHYKNVRNATKNLNLIASILEEGRGAITGHAYNQVQSSLNAIGKDLGMIVTYN